MSKLAIPAVLLLFLAASAFAQTAKVTVTQIKASGSGEKVTIDSRLDDLKDRLPKQFRFSDYSFLSRTSSTVSSAQPATWTLANGNSLDVTLVAVEGEGSETRYSLKVDVYAPAGHKSIMLTTVKVKSGTVTLFGVNQGQQEALILALKAE